MERLTENAAAFMRQLDIAHPRHLTIPITVIGAGAIGSHVTVALAKMGCSDITVWDDDDVSEHNYPNQLFTLALNGTSTIGMKKVEVLKHTVRELADVLITGHAMKIAGDPFLQGIVISGVDSMEARKLIWNMVKYQPTVRRYIDGRMGAQVGQLFHLNPNDVNQVEWYEKNLPSDEDTSELPCTARSICYTEFGIAAMVASIVRQELCTDRVSIPKQLTMDFQNGYICPDMAVCDVMKHL